jgi:poly-gamma-glutamate synthesis protein (capsule biosynthesis protein)
MEGKMAGKDTISLCAVGDVVAFLEDPVSGFEYVGPILREADIAFAQNERHYSERKDIIPEGGFTELTTPKHAEALKLGGFDVMSVASNHSLDLGPKVMLETIEILRNLGIQVIGAGRNIKEARKPAIIECRGITVGFLAYASVLRSGYHAGPNRPGCAPMRAWTHYHQIDYQPGTPPQILTFPHKEDLEAVIQDVRKVRSEVDVLAVSFHWGIHFYHAEIAMYEKEVAHAVIDAGADIILGHHPHLLKGIEVYKGKPIFYSMGNFIFDLPYEVAKEWESKSDYFVMELKLYGWKLDPEWTRYAYPPESRKSMIVKCHIIDKKIRRVSFLPVLINQKAQPQVVSRKDNNFDEFLDYINDITRSQDLKTKFSGEGNEIVVSLA